MDSQTLLYYSSRNSIFYDEIQEMIDKALPAKGERKQKAIDIIMMLHKAASHMDDYLEQMRFMDRDVKKLKLQNTKLIQQIKLRDQKIKELKAFMTDEL